ncbi:MAG: polysaccharide deacetylase family protein [Calditrichaceae bacterium]|jgi:peptidoglycan/xylan/chitin deacetylase (PgdA/CDA1 family)
MQINQIPIINYHKVLPNYDIGVTTRHPDSFETDLKILKSYNFNSITFDDLEKSRPLPDNPVIITFDDAYKSILENAVPIMQRYGFEGIIYPVTNFIGSFNDWDVQMGLFRFEHLSWRDLKECMALGFEIGSHTQSHELLTWMGPQKQMAELLDSRKELENILGVNIYSVSYPFGRFNADTLYCAEQAGYSYGLASVYYRKVNEQKQKYALKRFNIYRFDTKLQFERKLGICSNKRIFFRDWLIQKGGMGTAFLQSVRTQFHNNGKTAQAES